MDYQNHPECYKNMHCSLQLGNSQQCKNSDKRAKKRLRKDSGTPIPGGQSQEHVARSKSYDRLQDHRHPLVKCQWVSSGWTEQLCSLWGHQQPTSQNIWNRGCWMEGGTFHTFILSEHDVKRAFKLVNTRKAGGPDGISGRVLKLRMTN